MAELRLPPNPKVGKGNRFPAPEGAKRVRSFHIYRFDPEDVDLDDCALGRRSALKAIPRRLSKRPDYVGLYIIARSGYNIKQAIHVYPMYGGIYVI